MNFKNFIATLAVIGFFPMCYEKIKENKKTDPYCLFDITSDYWFSPLKVKASRTGNGIHLTWTQGGDYFGETTDSYCYLEYLNKAGDYLQYREIKAKCTGLKDHMYWFEADVNQPLLDKFSLSDVSKIILNYSPRVYKGKSGSYSSSYPRVIWQGEDFSMDEFASIDMDKDLVLYYDNKK